MSCPSTTKKVQNIFEEATKMRAAEEFQEIELSWAGRAQQPLAPVLTRAVSTQTQATQADAGAVQVGAGVTEAVRASAEKSSAVVSEPPRVQAAPAVGPLPEDPAVAAESQPGSASKPEGCKRSRQKKAECDMHVLANQMKYKLDRAAHSVYSLHRLMAISIYSNTCFMRLYHDSEIRLKSAR